MNNNIFATIFISITLSFSAVYGAFNYMPEVFFPEFLDQVITKEDLSKKIDKGIQDYIAKQNQNQQQAEQDRQKNIESSAKDVVKLDQNDYIYGKPEAPITLIEYSDFECPYCKRNQEVVKKLLVSYSTQVNRVYRHLPLDFHEPNASDQANAAECVGSVAGNNKYWEFVNAVFDKTKSNKGFKFEQIQPLAEELGVDVVQFNDCFSNKKMAHIVANHKKQAQSMGVSGTPANFLINNKTGELKFLGGAYPYESFVEVVEGFLE